MGSLLLKCSSEKLYLSIMKTVLVKKASFFNHKVAFPGIYMGWVGVKNGIGLFGGSQKEKREGKD